MNGPAHALAPSTVAPATGFKPNAKTTTLAACSTVTEAFGLNTASPLAFTAPPMMPLFANAPTLPANQSVSLTSTNFFRFCFIFY